MERGGAKDGGSVGGNSGGRAVSVMLLLLLCTYWI